MSLGEVKFRQPEGDVHYPVNEAMLPESRFVLRIFVAQANFKRRLDFAANPR